MSTSGGTGLNALAYLIVIVVAAAVAGRATGATLSSPSRGVLAIWVVVAVPSILQFPFPVLLDALARRPELITDGQVWRLLTSMVVQDGGLVGTVSNLVFLYVVASAAVPVWGTARAAVIMAIGAVGFNLFATFVFPQFGAGNSAATFALAASLPAALAVQYRTWWANTAAGVTAVVGVGLLLLRDAHGVAFLGGLVLGAGGTLAVPPRTAAR